MQIGCDMELSASLKLHILNVCSPGATLLDTGSDGLELEG